MAKPLGLRRPVRVVSLVVDVDADGILYEIAECAIRKVEDDAGRHAQEPFQRAFLSVRQRAHEESPIIDSGFGISWVSSFGSSE